MMYPGPSQWGSYSLELQLGFSSESEPIEMGFILLDTLCDLMEYILKWELSLWLLDHKQLL